MNHASLPNTNGQDFNDKLFSEKKALHFDPGSYFGKLGSHITENHCNHVTPAYKHPLMSRIP